TEPDSDGDDMECEDSVAKTNDESLQVEEGVDGAMGRRKGTVRLKGVSSKKRNAQLLTSPRRRLVQKGGEKVANGKNPKNQDMVKGTAGGGKPPKPKVDK
ncbi:hypothetical protein ISN44_As10g011110, partial [Arabidopsis suecica]